MWLNKIDQPVTITWTAATCTEGGEFLYCNDHSVDADV